ncbi:hypothetical protein EOI86_02790 [Hwanghaeella grinnelliae]|uniref:Uncharacterized protein n=1 Tax=Hwanghaeella grinnelliae TaxID=2500179 RepID=A0A437QUP1_9PROT|nr:hypothetical protein [Hwanghaeella grinnelliae]RVU38240.1 hypothetical protein EOI86_02790 [Hwanghaeella grinnelliae]
MRDRADLQLSRRETRDRSLVLLIVGAVLLMPPVASIFLLDSTVFGIPILIFYIFSVWFALIIGAAILAKPLGRMDYRSQSDTSSDQDG